MIEEFIAQSEANGYITSIEYYKALSNTELENLSKLKEEKAALEASLAEGVNDGVIKEGTEAWYEMCAEIDNVTLSIEEANTAMIEYGNSIREIEWEIFEVLQNQISMIANEADFLIDLMSNDKLYEDNGQFADAGLASMGLHGQNYNVYMAQADKYGEQIAKLKADLAADPANRTLADQIDELTEARWDAILAAEGEQDAIRDMVEEGINLELESLQELIDKYEDALDSQKDLYDYQKRIKDQVAEISSLEKQQKAYEGDTSEESMARIQEIKVQLEEARENLEESEYDQYISDQKELMDELYDEYEAILNERLDNIEVLMKDMIDEINTNSSKIAETLGVISEAVGYNISDQLNDIWGNKDSEQDVVSEYKEDIDTTVKEVVEGLGVALTDQIKDLDVEAKDKTTSANTSSSTTGTNSSSSSTTTTPSESDSSSTTSSSSSTASSSKSSWGSWFVSKKNNYPKSKLRINTSIVDRLKYRDIDSSFSRRKTYYSKMGGSGKYTGSAKQNTWMIKQMKAHGYKNGVFKIPNDEWAWTQEGRKTEAIIRPSDGAILTPLAKSDTVLNPEATRTLFDFANNPGNFLHEQLGAIDDLGNYMSSPQIGSNTFDNDFNITFDLPNVSNYEEFKNAMQHDKKFESMVRAMTVDKMFGGSSLKKYKY